MTSALKSSAIILKPKVSFHTWINSSEIKKLIPAEVRNMLNDYPLDVMRANASVMAIPLVSTDLNIDFEQFITKHAIEILTTELSRWGFQISAKPAKPELELLKEWFDISYHSNLFFFD